MGGAAVSRDKCFAWQSDHFGSGEADSMWKSANLDKALSG